MTTAPLAPTDVARALLDATLTAFRSNKGWADKAVAQLPDDKLHVALDPNTNCIAVIMKHVAGNLLSRWTEFLSTDGEERVPRLLHVAEADPIDLRAGLVGGFAVAFRVHVVRGLALKRREVPVERAEIENGVVHQKMIG